MKHKKLKTPVIYYVFAGILLLILAFAGYQALKIYLPQLEESKGFESIKEEAGIKDISAQEIIGSTEPSQSGETDNKTENAADNTPVLTLTQKNSDFVGWLSIEDTVIDYPVMKSDESDPEFFVIYGHNMNSGSMFGSLDSYKSGGFALEHKDIVFRTVKENRVYRVFAAFQTKLLPEDSKEFAYYRSVGELSKDEYEGVLENVRNMSLISLNEAPKYPEQIMFLSTCYYHTDEGRFVVAAYRIK